MPDHNAPRNFEFEREQPWGGGPIIKHSDLPRSFLVRGAMLRRSPPDHSDDATEEAAVVEPRGLPPPRLKTPPLRLYHTARKPDSSTPPPIEVYDIRAMADAAAPVGFFIPVPEFVMPTTRMPMPKRPLLEPVPGVSKLARGRHVPTKDSALGPNRKHACTAEGCGKVFTKRTHLNRHIKTLHRPEDVDELYFCYRANCDKSFTRLDNHLSHQLRHSHLQEILACAPEDEYKGVHLENPLVVNPGAMNIKPFANIAIHPTALNLWRFQEKQRMKGFDIPLGTQCDKYFAAHPEDRESCLRGDPKWDWAIPPAGSEFQVVDSRGSLEGVFKLDIKRDSA